MSRRTALVGLALLAAACATEPLPSHPAGQRPAADTDEAGLWMVADEAEERLRTSAARVRDPALEQRLKDITCRVAPDRCATVRIHVMRRPGFNAAMLPNGAVQVWTGTILRTTDDDQLAFVIAHEVADFELRHSLARWRDIKQKFGTAQLVASLTAPVAYGSVAGIAGASAIASSLAYSREQEYTADRATLPMLISGGFDPNAAPQILARITAEKEADPTATDYGLLATHPQTEDRLAALRRDAAAAPFEGRRPPLSPPLFEVGRAHRLVWLEDEVRLRRGAATIVMLDGLIASEGASGDLLFARGEVRRLRDAPGDRALAIEDLRAAVNAPSVPPAAWRSLGQVLLADGEEAEGRAALARYLEAAPGAPDRLMIESRIRS